MSITIIDKPRKIRRVITFDLEWIPGEQIPDGPCCDVVTHKLVSHLHTTPLQLRVAGVFDGKTFRSYPTVGAFLEHELTRKNRGAWFYAHAGGLADISFVFDEIIRWNASQCDDRLPFL